MEEKKFSFLDSELKKYYDENTFKTIKNGLYKEKIVSFRTNYIKATDLSIKQKLDKNNIEYDYLNLKNELLKRNYDINIFNELDFNFFILNNKKYYEKLISLDIYNNGEIYLQNPSTLLPVLFMDIDEKDNIIDMCAAPGGKSLFIKSLYNNKTNLTAVELNKIRYEKMIYNFKLQKANIYSINKNVLDLDNDLKFDKVLLDAPCSGSGVLNLNYILINKSIERQKKLIKKSFILSKKNAYLIYSTCSILNSENEEIIDIYKNKLLFDFKIFPDELFEGFYIAKFKN